MGSRRRLGDDFQRLWRASTASAVGSGLGAGALPLVAVLVLRASTLQVALLAAVSAAAAAAVAFPLGSAIDHRRKRPVMITADIVRFVALGSVPLAAALGRLTFVQLCAVGVAQTAAGIAFSAADGAHLKALVPLEDRAEANSRLATVFWLSQAGGPPLGGALISAAGATVTMLLDAVSFLASAVGITRLRQPEIPPPPRSDMAARRSEMAAGWRHVFADRELRRLFWNAMAFGGPITMISPLLAVFMLRTLHLATWEYGVALGVPCIGGAIGSRLAGRLSTRVGLRRTLLITGAARSPWELLIPLAPAGTSGLLVIIVAETGLLLAAGVFNPCFVTYRMERTADPYMARVASAWSISSKTVQPVCIALGGLLSTLLPLRAVISIGATLCCTSAALLPWRTETASTVERRPTVTVPSATAA